MDQLYQYNMAIFMLKYKTSNLPSVFTEFFHILSSLALVLGSIPNVSMLDLPRYHGTLRKAMVPLTSLQHLVTFSG